MRLYLIALIAAAAALLCSTSLVHAYSAELYDSSVCAPISLQANSVKLASGSCVDINRVSAKVSETR